MNVNLDQYLRHFNYTDFDTLCQGKGSDLPMYRVLGELNKENFAKMFDTLDTLRSLSFKHANFYITRPIALNSLVYDCRVHDQKVYFVVYYANGNFIAELCAKHGMQYYSDKNIWVRQLPIQDPNDIFGSLAPFLNQLIIEMSVFCQIMVNKHSLNKLYNSKLFF